VLGPSTRIVETGRPCTRAVYTGVRLPVNSGSGNRLLEAIGAIGQTNVEEVNHATLMNNTSLLLRGRFINIVNVRSVQFAAFFAFLTLRYFADASDAVYLCTHCAIFIFTVTLYTPSSILIVFVIRR